MSLAVLLIGPEARALAPRLRLSGYRPLQLAADGSLHDNQHDSEDDNEGGNEGGSPGDSVAVRDQDDAPGPAASPLSATCRPADPGPLAAVVLAPGEEARIPLIRHRWGAVPILLGSPEDSVAGRSRTLLSGADDFWLTGLGPSDLLTRLRLHRQLPAATLSGPERLQVADLQLIPATRQVSRGGRELLLTAREYQLLLLLLEHRDRVLSREQILRRVWQDQQGSASNVIEVYVRYLRQKLEMGGERRLLHTVRGRGYCLSEGPPPADPS